MITVISGAGSTERHLAVLVEDLLGAPRQGLPSPDVGHCPDAEVAERRGEAIGRDRLQGVAEDGSGTLGESLDPGQSLFEYAPTPQIIRLRLGVDPTTLSTCSVSPLTSRCPFHRTTAEPAAPGSRAGRKWRWCRGAPSVGPFAKPADGDPGCRVTGAVDRPGPSTRDRRRSHDFPEQVPRGAVRRTTRATRSSLCLRGQRSRAS